MRRPSPLSGVKATDAGLSAMSANDPSGNRLDGDGLHRRQLQENAGWRQTLSVAYNKIGDALAAGGNLTEGVADSSGQPCNSRRLTKADASNTDRQRDLAMSQGYVAAVLAEQGDTSRALDLLQQARVIIARLVEQSPANHQLSEDLAMFDDNIAKLEQANAPGPGGRRATGTGSRKFPRNVR